MTRRRDALDETLRRVLAALAQGERPEFRTAAHRAPAPRPTPGSRPADPSPAEMDRLVAALRALYDRTPGNDPAPSHPRYDVARRRFRERTAQLLEQLAFGERLADEVAPPLPEAGSGRSPAQQELRLITPARGVAAGLFLVTNDGDEPVEIHFEPGVLHAACPEAGPPVCFDAPVRFEPDAAVLAPARERTVRIEVDLHEAPAASGDDLELAVDVLARDALLGRLWVEIAVRGHRAEGELL